MRGGNLARVGLAGYPSVLADAVESAERAPLGTAMAKRFVESYYEFPDGSQCHRKAYITTALGGVSGERGAEGRGQGTKVRGHAEVPGRRSAWL